jgi:hypothetical protein
MFHCRNQNSLVFSGYCAPYIYSVAAVRRSSAAEVFWYKMRACGRLYVSVLKFVAEYEFVALTLLWMLNIKESFLKDIVWNYIVALLVTAESSYTILEIIKAKFKNCRRMTAVKSFQLIAGELTEHGSM